MRRLLGTALACSVLVLATGCSGDDRGGREVASASPTPTVPGRTPGSVPSRTPSEGLEKVRVVGLVVEVGDCVVVRDDHGTTWTMTGDRARDLTLDDRVQVTGTPLLAATGCGGPPVEVGRFTYLSLPE